MMLLFQSSWALGSGQSRKATAPLEAVVMGHVITPTRFQSIAECSGINRQHLRQERNNAAKCSFRLYDLVEMSTELKESYLLTVNVDVRQS